MNGALTIIEGDCLTALRALPESSVNCCVTSPPYWGLRDYGVAGQIGLEDTLESYVERLVEVFSEVARVLRDDGTLWLNLGDCYTASGWGGCVGRKSLNGGSQHAHDRAARKVRSGQRLGNRSSFRRDRQDFRSVPHRNVSELPTKNLIGVPWRVAFALQASGWVLRSDIIWHKPNPMPESVTDRPTKAHEYIFLFAKSERYHYNAEAIKEKASENSHPRGNGKNPKARHDGQNGSKQNSSFSESVTELVEARNKRSVWSVPTHPYKGAHFATFPPALIKPCILAGCPVGGTVLDPFGGSGTTGMVALELGRKAVLIELNPEYAAMACERCNVTAGLPL